MRRAHLTASSMRTHNARQERCRRSEQVIRSRVAVTCQHRVSFIWTCSFLLEEFNHGKAPLQTHLSLHRALHGAIRSMPNELLAPDAPLMLQFSKQRPHPGHPRMTDQLCSFLIADHLLLLDLYLTPRLTRLCIRLEVCPQPHHSRKIWFPAAVNICPLYSFAGWP